MAAEAEPVRLTLEPARAPTRRALEQERAAFHVILGRAWRHGSPHSAVLPRCCPLALVPVLCARPAEGEARPRRESERLRRRGPGRSFRDPALQKPRSGGRAVAESVARAKPWPPDPRLARLHQGEHGRGRSPRGCSTWWGGESGRAGSPDVVGFTLIPVLSEPASILRTGSRREETRDVSKCTYLGAPG